MTTKRYNILKDARVIADGNQDKVKFVYADINCRLKVHPISGEDKYFPLVVNSKISSLRVFSDLYLLCALFFRIILCLAPVL